MFTYEADAVPPAVVVVACTSTGVLAMAPPLTVSVRPARIWLMALVLPAPAPTAMLMSPPETIRPGLEVSSTGVSVVAV